jgi:hypothetical protein
MNALRIVVTPIIHERSIPLLSDDDDDVEIPSLPSQVVDSRYLLRRLHAINNQSVYNTCVDTDDEKST